MEMKCFFDFMAQPSSAAVQAHPIGQKIDDLKLAKGVYDGVDFPISFKQEYGKKLYDILYTGYATFYLISERMREILDENNLTGWKVFPIKLLDKKNNEIVGYHGFSVTGHCGPISYAKSKIIKKRYVPNGPI